MEEHTAVEDLVDEAKARLGERHRNRPKKHGEVEMMEMQASFMLSFAYEVQRAYHDQIAGTFAWGIIREDLDDLFAHAIHDEYEARVARWYLTPKNARAAKKSEKEGHDASTLQGYPVAPEIPRPPKAAPYVVKGWVLPVQDYLKRMKAAQERKRA